jgi:uncharacterized protein YrrD
MKADTIKKLAVVSIDDGAKLGYVDELLFDMKDLRVAALHVSLDKKHALIPYEQIRGIGSDAITIPAQDAAVWQHEDGTPAGMQSLDDVHKLKVVDQGGNYLGTIQEIQIGRIVELKAHKGGVLGIGGDSFTFSAGAVSSVGPEVMIVPAGVTEGTQAEEAR